MHSTLADVETEFFSFLGDWRNCLWLAPARMLRRHFANPGRIRNLPSCKSILVIRPDEIGDVVMTSPFFRNLRKASPNAHITVLTNEVCRPLLESCPYVNKVRALPFKPNVESRHRARLVMAAMKFKLARVCRGFDMVLLPRGDADWYSAELVGHMLAGRGTLITNTASFIKWTIEPPRSPGLADVRYEVNTPQSDMLSNLEFLRFCGGSADGKSELEFWSGPQDKTFAEQWLAGGDTLRPKLVFHPPSGRSVLKRWPVGRSHELLAKIVSETDFEVIVVGSEQDRWVLEELGSLDGGRIRVALDEFTLPQLGEVIRRCGYFVGGDSGPMHIAAAVGARVVGIFGFASETRFRPWSDTARVVSLHYHCSPDERGTYEGNCMTCRYPENRCLAELSADQVLSAVLEFLI